MMYRLRLKDLREDADLKQAEIAEMLNCSQTCYSKWELDQRDLPKKVLIQLANYYGTSTDYLLGITNIKEPYPKNTFPVNWKEKGTLDQ